MNKEIYFGIEMYEFIDETLENVFFQVIIINWFI